MDAMLCDCENVVVFRYFVLGLILGFNQGTNTEMVRAPVTVILTEKGVKATRP